jgi:TonB family protein
MEYQKPLSRTLRHKLAMLASFALLTSAQLSLAADPPAGPEKVSVEAEIYIDPKPGESPEIIYPTRELNDGVEGWVYVWLMIDPQGKPHELEIAESTGNKEFEKRALESVALTQFEPATLGGKPVDACVIYPVFFRIHGNEGMAPAFVKTYNEFATALKSKDKAAAQAAMSKLQARNFSEIASLGMVKFAYAKRWGTDEEQLIGLRMAIARMTEASYLSYDTFTYALQSRFLVQAKTQDFAGALWTWKTLKPLEKDPAVLEKLSGMAKEIEAYRTDPQPYSVPAKLSDGVWSYYLFRNKFRINVIRGRVSQIKLYCERKFVLFPFDPKVEYTVEEGVGKCSIVVRGDSGTSIELVQKS